MRPQDPDSGPQGGTRPGSGLGRRHLVLAALCSLALLTYLDRIAISRVQGDVERDLRLGELSVSDEAALAAEGKAADPAARAALQGERARDRMAWIFTAFLFGYVLFEIPGGRLGDRYGPRRVITRIVIWWSLFTALTGSVRFIGGWISSNPGPELLLVIMLVVRFLFGLGEAGAFPNIARALGRWFPYEERARAQGFIWMSSRIGGAMGPLVVGWLMGATGSWERAFWCLGGVGIVWATVFALWYRDRPEDMAGTSDAEKAWIRGARAGSPGGGPGRGDGSDGESDGDGESPAGGEGADSIYDDAEVASPPWARLILWPNALAIYLASAGVSFSFYFFLTFLPRYLKEAHGKAFADSEIMSGLPLFIGAIACLIGGRLSDLLVLRLRSRRWGRALPGCVGFTLAGLCMLAALGAPGPWTAVTLFSAAFFFQDLGVPCLWSLPADVGGRHAGVLAGCMNSVGAVGGVLSPLAAAWIRSHSEHAWGAVIVTYAAAYLLAGLAWLAIDASRAIEE